MALKSLRIVDCVSAPMIRLTISGCPLRTRKEFLVLACDGILEAYSPGTRWVAAHQSPSAVAALETDITVRTIADKLPSEVTTCPELSYLFCEPPAQ